MAGRWAPVGRRGPMNREQPKGVGRGAGGRGHGRPQVWPAARDSLAAYAARMREAKIDEVVLALLNWGIYEVNYKDDLTRLHTSLYCRVLKGDAPMTKKASGKAFREGLTVIELMDMFPTEEAATAWFEDAIWPHGRHCPHCGNTETTETKNHKPMPYWCGGCRSYFSVRTGTPMQRSKVPLRKWAIAIYLVLTSLKSVSSMKLQRDIGVSQPTAWFMLHRIREAWAHDEHDQFDGQVEVDESHIRRPSREYAAG